MSETNVEEYSIFLSLLLKLRDVRDSRKRSLELLSREEETRDELLLLNEGGVNIDVLALEKNIDKHEWDSFLNKQEDGEKMLSFSNPDIIHKTQRLIENIALEKLKVIEPSLDKDSYFLLEEIIKNSHASFSGELVFNTLMKGRDDATRELVQEASAKNMTTAPLLEKEEFSEMGQVATVGLASSLVIESIKLSEETIEKYADLVMGLKNTKDSFAYEEKTSPNIVPEYPQEAATPTKTRKR